MTPWNAQGPLAHPRGPLRHHRFPLVFSNQTRPSRWSRRPPGMRLGPMGIPGARYATIVFHYFFPIKPAPAGGVDDSLECPKPFQDVALYNTKGSCSLTCSPKTTPLDQCGGVYGGRGFPEDRGFDCRLSMEDRGLDCRLSMVFFISWGKKDGNVVTRTLARQR